MQALMIPQSEAEEVEWTPPLRTVTVTTESKGKTYIGLRWQCLCGMLCTIYNHNAPGGKCGCQRQWNIDRVEGSALLLVGVTGYERKR